MHNFAVQMVEPNEPLTVAADYFVTDGDFVVFKDAEHKQVAAVRAAVIASVTRTQSSTSVGTATIRIIPEVDADALAEAIDRAVDRLPHTPRRR